MTLPRSVVIPGLLAELEAFGELIAALDGSAWGSPYLYLNELAGEFAPVRMTGNYGGEVLRRVRAFKPVAPVAGLFTQDFSPYVGMARQTYAEVIGGHPLSFAVFRQAPWHHYG